MAGRPKHYEDEELIDRATKVFWQKGYNAASAQDLMSAMDIGQGSFYRTFPGGKKELYQKTLERFLAISINSFHKGLEACDDPIQYIKDFFSKIPIRSAQEKENGCYLGNAIVELSNLDEETKSLSVSLLTKLKNGFEKALVRAQKEGRLSSDKSPKLLALVLMNLWNGINVTQRMYPQKKQILETINATLQILN